jgi:hypothetical protein
VASINKEVVVSLKWHVMHLFGLKNHGLQGHPSFLFTTFNILHNCSAEQYYKYTFENKEESL